MTDIPADVAARIAALEKENEELRKLVETNASAEYTNSWIAEQVKRTAMLCDENDLMRVFRIYGNRVLMQFGDAAGMHKAFSEAYELNNSDPKPTQPAPAEPVKPVVVVPEGWHMEVLQNDFETQLTLWGPGEDQVIALPVPVDSKYAEMLREFAGALEKVQDNPELGEWHDIHCAPKDKLILVAAEFDGPGDWRIKVGGYWDDRWHVHGGSWTPTRWKYLPAPPTYSVKALKATG